MHLSIEKTLRINEDFQLEIKILKNKLILEITLKTYISRELNEYIELDFDKMDS